MKYVQAVQNSNDLFKHQIQTSAGTGRLANLGSLYVNLRMKRLDHGSEQKPKTVKICVTPRLWDLKERGGL